MPSTGVGWGGVLWGLHGHIRCFIVFGRNPCGTATTPSQGVPGHARHHAPILGSPAPATVLPHLRPDLVQIAVHWTRAVLGLILGDSPSGLGTVSTRRMIAALLPAERRCRNNASWHPDCRYWICLGIVGPRLSLCLASTQSSGLKAAVAPRRRPADHTPACPPETLGFLQVLCGT